MDYCEKLLTEAEILTTSSEINAAVLLFIVACLSMMVSSTVALIMYYNKPLLQHPNQLIFFMCIAEATAAWSSLIA